ncbi:MAG: (d)CMP kinase [Myxococcales bacterium]|nr:(d)CMP kinase [Myxococcales bacterium]
MIIAIDGPAGSGKSTISARLAAELGYQLIDTGALYRCVALAAIRGNLDLSDGTKLGQVAAAIRVRFRFQGGRNRVFLDGEDVTDAIRTAEAGVGASRVAAHPAVREALLSVQRQLGLATNSVMEGRDIGTVVFPDADYKIYLTASLEERARRRWSEFGLELPLYEVKRQIQERDERDMNRAVAPLLQAEDATLVDTTGLSLDEVVAELKRIVVTPG